jgi:3-oxoacyl-[acyl-carrier-protein] synthase-3
MNVRIAGVGLYLPPKIETAAQVAEMILHDEQWIISKTGVKEHRISEVDVDIMGAAAGKEAIGDGPPPDLIINASGVPKQTIPDTSVFFQREMGYEGIQSFSVHGTCLSFIIALNTAAAFIQCNSANRVLIISSDRGTRGRNFDEPESAALLGDGAAAVVVEASDGVSKLHHWNMKTWPSGANLTEVRGGGTNKHPQDPDTTAADNLFTMDGPKVYKMAMTRVYKLMEDTFKSVEFEKNDVDWVIPHQASLKAVQAYYQYGGFNKEKVISIVEKTGNCVAASLPMAFVSAVKEEKIKRGDLIYLIGTGAGFSAASALLTY